MNYVSGTVLILMTKLRIRSRGRAKALTSYYYTAEMVPVKTGWDT